MSKHANKFTEGPWFASADDATDCPDHKHSGLAMIDTGRSSDWPIARLMEWNNVPLVLAAPELLEALETVLEFWDTGSAKDDRGELTADEERRYMALHEDVRKIVSRAKGVPS